MPGVTSNPVTRPEFSLHPATQSLPDSVPDLPERVIAVQSGRSLGLTPHAPGFRAVRMDTAPMSAVKDVDR
jgi:hypothetical protein